MEIESYLSFEGRTEEAFEFYRQAPGAEQTMKMLFKDSPMPMDPKMHPPGCENKVMHMSFRIGKTTLLASDGRCSGTPKFEGVSLALSVPTDEEAHRRFKALAEGGEIHMPLAPTFFSSNFGMVADRFGLRWMVLVAK